MSGARWLIPALFTRISGHRPVARTTPATAATHAASSPTSKALTVAFAPGTAWSRAERASNSVFSFVPHITAAQGAGAGCHLQQFKDASTQSPSHSVTQSQPVATARTHVSSVLGQSD